MPLPPLNTIITMLHDVYDTMDERPQTAKLDLGTFINVLVTERQHPLRINAGDRILSDGRRLIRQRDVQSLDGLQAATWRTKDGMGVLASHDPTPNGTLLHISISYADRDPSWDDLKAVRAAFFPTDADVMMVLPAAADYVNLHQHCFHLWQTPSAWQVQ